VTSESWKASWGPGPGSPPPPPANVRVAGDAAAATRAMGPGSRCHFRVRSRFQSESRTGGRRQGTCQGTGPRQGCQFFSKARKMKSKSFIVNGIRIRTKLITRRRELSSTRHDLHCPINDTMISYSYFHSCPERAA
jgi:hypothetical protein